jgi:transposase InsO family protein
MSRKGECHDNAVAESFFSSLKTELTDDEDYFTRSQAKQSIFEKKINRTSMMINCEATF